MQYGERMYSKTEIPTKLTELQSPGWNIYKYNLNETVIIELFKSLAVK